MSRQASKARGDKGKGAQTTPNPAMQHEIIPGKFTEHDWNLASAPGENEDFIVGIVGEIVDNAMGQIYESYLQRQLIPFTVSEAKDAILEIIDWNFLAHDKGESSESLRSEAWEEDEEPLSATIDSWGQGCIPKTAVTPRLSSSNRSQPEPIAEEAGESEMAATPMPEGEEEEETRQFGEEEEEAAKLQRLQEEEEEEGEEEQQQQRKEEEEVEATRNRRSFRFRPYRGKLRSAGLSAMSETLHETEQRLRGVDVDVQLLDTANHRTVPDMPASCLSILKVQAGRPPGNKEVIYDEAGNVVSVVKISADKLPMHRVNVGYRVLQPELEAEKARLEALKKGIRVTAKPSKTIKQQQQQQQQQQQHQRRPGDSRPGQAAPQPAPDPKVESLPPSLVETIDLAAGVSVREAGLVRSGPPAAKSGNERFAEIHLKGLRPVQARASQSNMAGSAAAVATTSAGITAADILPAERVFIKPPINMRPPIPPIQQSAR